MLECIQRPASPCLVTLRSPFSADSVSEPLLYYGIAHLGALGDSFGMCGVLLNCCPVWPHWQCLQDSGTSLPLQERKLLPNPHSAGLWWRGEPPQISCKMHSLEPRLCIMGWHRQDDNITTELSLKHSSPKPILLCKLSTSPGSLLFKAGSMLPPACCPGFCFVQGKHSSQRPYGAG